MLKIWGRISSINVRKVVLAAQWLGIPFERLDAGGEFGVVKSTGYLAKNPNAMVPTIEDNGLVLWESNVIVRYLAAKYPLDGFYPAALAGRFKAEQWMDWQQTALNPAGREAFIQLIRTAPEQRNPDAIAKSVAATEPLMTMLQEHLSRHAFITGESFGMADVPIACELHRWRGLPIEHPPRPDLDRWYQGVLAQPASRGVLDLPLS